MKSTVSGSRRSYSDRDAGNYSLPPADCYRPNYERVEENPTNPPLRTPRSRSSIDTPISAGPKTTRSEPNASPVQDVQSSKGNGRASVRDVKINALIQLPEDGNRLPRVDILQEINTLAGSITLSSSSIMKGERSRREAGWRAKLHQRHLRHREAFPMLVEELEFRAGRAEQVHREIEDETDRAQKRQESAASALALTLGQIQPTGARSSHEIADFASLRAEVQTMNERVSVTESAVAEVARLSTDLCETKESLDNARREIDYINRNALSEETFEIRLQQYFNEFVTREVYKTSEAKLTNLTHDWNNRKTELANIHDFIMSIPNDIKQWSNLVEKHETRLSSIRDAVSGNSSSIQDALGMIESQKKESERGFQMLRNTISKLNGDVQDIKSNAEAVDMPQPSSLPQSNLAHQACISKDDLVNMEQKVEVGYEKLLQIIREEQSVGTETFMQGAQEITTVLEQHAKDLTVLKQTITDLSKRFLVTQDQRPANASPCQLAGGPQGPVLVPSNVQVPGNTSSRQSGGVSQDRIPISSNAPVSQFETRFVNLERHVQAMGQFVVNQQQKFDNLTTKQLTQNMINAMAQMYPQHPAHIAAQINQLVRNHKITEGIVSFLRTQYTALDTTIKNRFSTEVQPIGDKIKELNSSQAALQQYWTVTHDQAAADIVNFKTQAGDDLKKVMNDVESDLTRITKDVNGLISEVGRLKTRPLVSSPTPPSLDSRVPSISLGVLTEAVDSDPENSLHIRNRSPTRVSSTGTPLSHNGNGKRQRTSPSSSDDDIPLSAKATAKRQKQIRRMNKSTGGFS